MFFYCFKIFTYDLFIYCFFYVCSLISKRVVFLQDNPRYVSTNGKSVRSPSPRRRPLPIPNTSPQKTSPVTDEPPALPSRTRSVGVKPTSPSTPIGGSPARHPISPKPPAPPPHSCSPEPTPDRNSPTKPNPFTNRPLPPIHSLNKTSPTSNILTTSAKSLDSDSVTLKNNINDSICPLQTSSPKLSPKSKIPNGKLTNGTDLDDSLDSGSFDQDSLDESEDIEAMAPASREAFKQVTTVVLSSIKSLSTMAAICTEAQKTGNSQRNEAKFQAAKDTLTSESRQFVTASKLFVKSATESEETLLQCLSNCLSLLQSMVEVTQQVVQHTSTPLQTQNVVVKVRDVSSTYHTTVRAALAAAGRGLDHPSMSSLMTHATNLAGVLTALMRTLRVFSP